MKLLFKLTIFWSLSQVSGDVTTEMYDDPLGGIMRLQEVCERLYQMKCPDGSCISVYRKCDFEKPPFPGGIDCEWELCDDGTCINPYHGCIGKCGYSKKECPDGSCVGKILGRCPGECDFGERKCPDGKCYDTFDVCPDRGCSTYRPHSCGGGSTDCYQDSDKCDNVKDCDNGYDEDGCPGLSGSTNNILLAIGIPCVVIAVVVAMYYRCNKKSSRYGGSSTSSPSSPSGGVTSPPHQSSGARMQPVVISYDFTSTTPTYSTTVSGSEQQGAQPYRPTGEQTHTSPSAPQENSGGPPVYGAHEAFPLHNPGATDSDPPPSAAPPSYDDVMAGYMPPKQEPS